MTRVDEVIAEMQRIWVHSTADSIAAELDRARALVEMLPPAERDRAERMLESLERLSRWLHDL